MNNKFVVLALVLCVTLCRSCCVSAVGIEPIPETRGGPFCCDQCSKQIADLEFRVSQLEKLLKVGEPTPAKEFDGLGKMPPPAGTVWRFVPKSEWGSLPIGTKNQDGCTWDGKQWVCPLKGKK